MRLREGAAFRRGELLAVVDPRPLEDALESAPAPPAKPLSSVQREGGARLVSKLSQEALRRLTAGGDVAFAWEGQELSARTSRVYPALDALHLGTVETDLAAPPFGLPVGSTVE